MGSHRKKRMVVSPTKMEVGHIMRTMSMLKEVASREHPKDPQCEKGRLHVGEEMGDSEGLQRAVWNTRVCQSTGRQSCRVSRSHGGFRGTHKKESWYTCPLKIWPGLMGAPKVDKSSGNMRQRYTSLSVEFQSEGLPITQEEPSGTASYDQARRYAQSSRQAQSVSS